MSTARKFFQLVTGSAVCCLHVRQPNHPLKCPAAWLAALPPGHPAARPPARPPTRPPARPAACPPLTSWPLKVARLPSRLAARPHRRQAAPPPNCPPIPNQFQTSSKPVPNQFQTSSKPSSKPPVSFKTYRNRQRGSKT